MHALIHRLARHLAQAGVLAVATTSQAGAATLPTPAELRAMSPAQLLAFMQARLVSQQEDVASRAAAGLDVTPPVLTRFAVPARVRAGEAIGVNYSATDDMSGVVYMSAYITASKDRSRWDFATDWRNYPSLSLHGTAGIRFDVYTPSDTYTVNNVYVIDAANNVRKYEGSELQALGNTVTQVQNPRGDDNVPPSLVRGKVLTPTVSLSTPQPGTTRPMWAGVRVEMADTGEVVSGPLMVNTTFCKTDGVTCLSFTSMVYAPNKHRAVVETGASLAAGTATGEYLLRHVSMVDWAQNQLSLESKVFGGTTDFSLYFPGTSLTVVP